jgi:hypothetical protein
MKERPILFKAEMVRAILAGAKTQTRRICRPRFDDRTPCEHYSPIGSGGVVSDHMMRHCEHGSEGQPCPLGVAGDRLRIREAWRTSKSLDHVKPSNLVPGAPIIYESDGAFRGLSEWGAQYVGKSRPSIFMPRWASRITLEIISVRAERLQDITDGDARAEGIERMVLFGENKWRNYASGGYNQWEIGSFKTLWDSINAKRGYGWDANPWVWRIEFKLIK